MLGTRALWIVACCFASSAWGVDSVCEVRGPGRPDLVFRAGFEDGDCEALVGLPCDGGDTDFCFEGTIACVAGAPMCSDTTGSTTELCNGLDDDCDGAVDEDFVPNTNPPCAGALFMGSVAGDQGSGTLMAQGMTEQWLRFRLREDDTANSDIAASITLDMPVGIDYDLLVYCANCGGLLAGSSLQTGSGVQERVTVAVDDPTFPPGIDNSIDVIVEVRHRAHTVCASWSLTVTGNVPPMGFTCP